MLKADWIVNTDADVFTSEDNAIEVAFNNLDCIPAAVSQWLAEACDIWDTDRHVHHPFKLGSMADKGVDLTPSQALVVLFGGTDKHAIAALYTLRQQYRDSVSDDAHAIGREAWEKQCLEDKHIINMGRDYE